jgi:hypothetical protein
MAGSRSNTSRRLQPKTAHMQAFDLREAARAWCPQALEVVKACLEHKDAGIRLKAAEILFNRSYGKPEVTAAITSTHQFAVAVVPNVIENVEDWVKCRGQPDILARMKAACPDGPTDADMLDLKANPGPEADDVPD